MLIEYWSKKPKTTEEKMKEDKIVYALCGACSLLIKLEP